MYILVCVDVLSRKMYAEPARRKDYTQMRPAFDAIFERARTRPWKLYTDNGGEFVSAQMRAYFRKKDVIQLTASPVRALHATMAERSIRTIKERLYKYFSENNTVRWLDALQDIIEAINNSVSRPTGMTPNEVTEANAVPLHRRLYGAPEPRERLPKFAVGDTVRVQKHKLTFAKGLATFTDKIFYVTDVLAHRHPPVYRLKDGRDRPLQGLFYERELVRCPPAAETTTRIAKIHRTRVHNGQLQYYVSWLNHERDFDQWIPANALVRVAADAVDVGAQ
ncbi:hypothetical protein AAVH_31295 [Aphelenchoides avenae]|nr:hypothetical protein AAVH_31295 [Aphelenchus avenae]